MTQTNQNVNQVNGYDPAGDVTYDGANNYLYDGEGRLCAVQTGGNGGSATGYLYNADGTRVVKGSMSTFTGCPSSASSFSAVQAQYLLDLSGDQVTELNGTLTNGAYGWVHSNIWAAGTLDATYDTKGLHFHLKDWLGTRRMQTSAAGGWEEEFQSLPFGDGFNKYQSSLPTADDATEHHFTGKERDTESGNDYFKYRYYASSTGRWLSPDPSGLMYANAADPQSFNLYSYVGNEPLTRADLLGLCWRGFNWACNLYQRVRNWIGGDGFHTDDQNTLHPGRATQKRIHQSYIKETLGAVRDFVHMTVCTAASPLTATAQGLQTTTGVGVGGNAGVGFILGVAVDGSVQAVADQHGNVGLAITVGGNPGYGVFGAGAMAGGQVSVSNADSIDDLKGPTWDFGVSGALPEPLPPNAASLDVAVSGPNATATLTVGEGVGGKGAALTGNYTFLPLSTNCR
jgi:RHS repeat-associated protein